MKKIIAATLVPGMFACMSASATALDLMVSGVYTVGGYQLSATNGSGFDMTTDGAGADAFYAHTFQVLPVMKVSEPITMHGDIRLADDTVFGTDDTNTLVDGETQRLNIHKIYMNYDSPLGIFRVGRTQAGLWYSNFLNTDRNSNRIMWWPTLLPKPWEMLLYTEKVAEDDDNSVTTDQDTDRYHFGISHEGEQGLGALAYDHHRVAATDSGYGEAQIYGGYKINNLNLQIEAVHRFGDDQADTTIDYDSWAAMVDVNGSFAGTTAGLLYFYASGDDEGSAGDNEAFFDSTGGLGEDFQPLYILTGYFGGLLNQHVGSTSIDDDGVHGYCLYADQQLTEKLVLHAALGYGEVDEEPAGRDDDLGWEFNLGAVYNLLDNLAYEARFGYLAGGDYFRIDSNDAEKVTLLSHHLTMEF